MAAVYIDKNKVKTDLMIPKPDTEWQDGYISAMEVARKEADSQSTSDVVDRSKVDKAIQEMESKLDGLEMWDIEQQVEYYTIKECVAILKRNIGE